MDQHQELAEKVVAEFKGMLSDSARKQISDAQFDDLALMIRGVIAEELGAAVAILEEALGKLRSRVEEPDLGL